MKKEDLKAISKRMDENNEFENWVASVIDIRLEENDYELDELLECDNEKEVLFMLKEQWDELHNPDYFPEDEVNEIFYYATIGNSMVEHGDELLEEPIINE